MSVLPNLSACTSTLTPPLSLAPQVNLDRMYGGWYILATIPNSFEKGMVTPYDVYEKRADGYIREDFYVKWGSFNAPQKHYTVHDWVKPGTNNAYWHVQVFWPINLPFLLLYVDPDYRYVLYGEQGQQLGWIYSRRPMLSDDDYAAIYRRFAALGYDTSKFRKVVQRPEDIGQPGFWSDAIQP